MPPTLPTPGIQENYSPLRKSWTGTSICSATVIRLYISFPLLASSPKTTAKRNHKRNERCIPVSPNALDSLPTAKTRIRVFVRPSNCLSLTIQTQKRKVVFSHCFAFWTIKAPRYSFLLSYTDCGGNFQSYNLPRALVAPTLVVYFECADW